MPISSTNSAKVLMLFLVPVGGGIPGGVLLAKSFGMSWGLTSGLYFISDLILACFFDPIVKIAMRLGSRSPWAVRVGEEFQKIIKKSLNLYGHRSGPLALVFFAFGADPMTGRMATMAAGHGFVSGWLLAITGDMLYFGLIMASTLWLKDVIGDGQMTMFIILALMIGIPVLIRKFRERVARS